MNTLGTIIAALTAINLLILFWLERNATHKIYDKDETSAFRFFEGYFIGTSFVGGLLLIFFVICKYLEA